MQWISFELSSEFDLYRWIVYMEFGFCLSSSFVQINCISFNRCVRHFRRLRKLKPHRETKLKRETAMVCSGRFVYITIKWSIHCKLSFALRENNVHMPNKTQQQLKIARHNPTREELNWHWTVWAYVFNVNVWMIVSDRK